MQPHRPPDQLTTHPFYVGRSALRVPAIWATGQTVSYVFWYATFGNQRSGVAIMELVGVLTTLIAVASLTPKMASWEATAVPLVRRLATLHTAAVLISAALGPLVIYLALTSLPTAIVPGAARFDIAGLEISQWLPIATNLAVITSIVALAIALTGRLVGTVIALSIYASLFWLDARTGVAVPYTTLDPARVQTPHWLASVLLLAAALTTWWCTGGTTRLSRLLDPPTPQQR